MRVTVVELPARWGEPLAALADVDRILAGGPATDLVVLPETSLTGYVSPDGDFDLRRFAEPLDGATATATAALATKHGVHLLAPLVLHDDDDGTASNSVVLFAPTGARVLVYEKRHPWFPETWARAGAKPPPIVEVDGKKLTVAICFDVHFLAEDAAEQLRAADLLLFPSAWVDDQDTRLELLAGLAERFDVAVAAANWGAGAVVMRGQGSSCILDRRGKIITRVKGGGSRADATI
jgi:predicted amidohydrolase